MIRDFKCPSCGNPWEAGGAQLTGNKIVCNGCLKEFKIVPKEND